LVSIYGNNNTHPYTIIQVVATRFVSKGTIHSSSARRRYSTRVWLISLAGELVESAYTSSRSIAAQTPVIKWVVLGDMIYLDRYIGLSLVDVLVRSNERGLQSKISYEGLVQLSSCALLRLQRKQKSEEGIVTF
jgi:hypothetical protein